MGDGLNRRFKNFLDLNRDGGKKHVANNKRGEVGYSKGRREGGYDRKSMGKEGKHKHGLLLTYEFRRLTRVKALANTTGLTQRHTRRGR